MSTSASRVRPSSPPSVIRARSWARGDASGCCAVVFLIAALFILMGLRLVVTLNGHDFVTVGLR